MVFCRHTCWWYITGTFHYIFKLKKPTVHAKVITLLWHGQQALESRWARGCCVCCPGYPSAGRETRTYLCFCPPWETWVSELLPKVTQFRSHRHSNAFCQRSSLCFRRGLSYWRCLVGILAGVEALLTASVTGYRYRYWHHTGVGTPNRVCPYTHPPPSSSVCP